LPGEELCDSDVVLQELGDSRIKIGSQGSTQEFCDCHIVGPTWRMQELGNSGIIGGLAEELGHWDIVVFQELGYGGV
jgi:hypothetical protein